nr:immunoglobulin heavy chain junction region [Mus musculus]
LCNQLGGYGLL